MGIRKKMAGKLFSALESNKEWLITTTFAENMQNFPPLGRFYIPCGSYAEMMEWALPAETTLEYQLYMEELKNRKI